MRQVPPAGPPPRRDGDLPAGLQARPQPAQRCSAQPGTLYFVVSLICFLWLSFSGAVVWAPNALPAPLCAIPCCALVDSCFTVCTLPFDIHPPAAEPRAGEASGALGRINMWCCGGARLWRSGGHSLPKQHQAAGAAPQSQTSRLHLPTTLNRPPFRHVSGGRGAWRAWLDEDRVSPTL